ncbi:MAG: glutamate dehydrogenase/leucine dehydrogenase [Phenylobacterium sp.]|jgi:glutamate dehydrogenase/leucine dehydrogenase
MTTKPSTALSALLLCLFYLCTQPLAQAQPAQNQTPQVSGVFRQHVNMLNELSERRRGNTFFTNEQSIFYGAQIGSVNTGFGNATFIRRDLISARLETKFQGTSYAVHGCTVFSTC